MLSVSPCLVGVLLLLCSCWHESCSASGDGPSESECQPFVIKALHELQLTDNADIQEQTEQNEQIIVSDAASVSELDNVSGETAKDEEIFIAESRISEDEEGDKPIVTEHDSSIPNSAESREGLDLSSDATVSQVAPEIGSLSRENSEEEVNIQENVENSSTDDARSAEYCKNNSCAESQEVSSAAEETQMKKDSLASTEIESPEDDTNEQSREATIENSAELESDLEKKNATKSENQNSETDVSDGSNADNESNEEIEVPAENSNSEGEASHGSNADNESNEETEVLAENKNSEEEASDGSNANNDSKEETEAPVEPVGEDNEKNEDTDEHVDEGTLEKENDEIISNEIVSSETEPEDELLPIELKSENLRNTDHIDEILYKDYDKRDEVVGEIAESILRELKRIYENAIRPLEVLYKYRDLSNRHFGDAEIFSKPLILFMGPWSGGKSTIINYLTNNQNTEYSLKSGAEPSPAYFNILMHGEEVEILDGTRLVADWTFSGLQKFGQGLEDHLHGLKLPSNLLKKVNIVEIPGILEVRKQVSRVFPFNDACQWFIDRADIIFLVYDPTKLDVGPETEAILDQLKGREYQTRILLNKADRIKSEELIRVQSALIWNISPLMSSAQPPIMYTVSLWSNPFEKGAPTRLLQAQENALLKDIRSSIDKRIENKISGARRFAIRVRNHAKMVDCYLTTYYNHKSLFGNKKRIAEQIIQSPQNYHIYEGLSTLTNISRYDLPDPEVYRDFFHLNSLYEFKKLSETCTYFRGCPISKLDVAIAYDLPELVGKYKKLVDSALRKLNSDAS